MTTTPKQTNGERVALMIEKLKKVGVGGLARETIRPYLIEALEAKDSTHREELKRVVESLDTEKRDCLTGGFSGTDHGYNQKCEEDQEWKTTQLSKLK